MLRTVLGIVVVLIGIQSCDHNGGSTRFENASYEETKMSLEDKERSNPVAFLSDESTYRNNFIGEWVLEGYIRNSATSVTYKDVVLNITYYSKTDTELGSEQKVIYDFFAPGRSKPYKVKTIGYQGTSSVAIDVIGASSAN